MDRQTIIKHFEEAISGRDITFSSLKENVTAIIGHVNRLLATDINIYNDGDIAPDENEISYIQFSDSKGLFAEIAFNEGTSKYQLFSYPDYISNKEPEAIISDLSDIDNSGYLARTIYNLLPPHYRKRLDNLTPPKP